jgi:glycosidase
LILVLLAESNPAIRAKDGIFTDQHLRSSALFTQLISALQTFFKDKSETDRKGISLVDLLLEPVRKYPNSLFDQLSFIAQNWGEYLDQVLLRSLIIGLDQLKEEIVPAAGGKITQNPLGDIADAVDQIDDPVNFSPDREWMPNVVLQAKNVYVWLDQLTREYQRRISKLDQVPEEELAKLYQRGINTLWLIGIWERSPASQRIKQLCGNPEAASSAYSLYDYTISEKIGGESAYQHLSSSAEKYHIRLAADMVPNHMGIDSHWISEYPEYFLSLDTPPFPGYSFNGPDLSSSPDLSIYLEDHYYDRSDAAVVFKRRNNRTGDSQYIYHGNDGTSMPWNDTAQLDYLNPEVREAVIQSILEVARKFSVIRFDAAMTLSKKHYQRLWFPQPGSGGAIPTRSSFSLSKKEFDAHMPVEFWRELVDRVAEEVPDTLLLAEAFWMMEGYFVRTLGMHRVYNSAFMHMLRDEDNEKYRQLIIDTLEFDPQIMKRYVNFMNNPDEETALSQFGSGGKYFGTCLVMSTLPGLPMFGHGQIEGLAEKYGMEYLRAYFDESPDPAFVARHEREIFPLLHKRYLFSGVDHFELFDLRKQDRNIDDNVFAFSNRAGDENALVIFHNKWGDTRGWIFNSTPINGKSTTITSALGLSDEKLDYVTFSDQITGLEYIRSLKELKTNGLYLDLGSYQYHAFLNFKAIRDPDGSLKALENFLDGAGTDNLHRHKLEIRLSPLIEPISSLLSQSDRLLISHHDKKGSSSKKKEQSLEIITKAGESYTSLLPSIFPQINIDLDRLYNNYLSRAQAILILLSNPHMAILSPQIDLLLAWSFLADLPMVIQNEELDIIIDLVNGIINNLSKSNKRDYNHQPDELALMVKLTPQLADIPLSTPGLIELWLENTYSQQYINLHIHEGKKWFHKESMESLMRQSLTLIYLNLLDSTGQYEENRIMNYRIIPTLYQNALIALVESEYQADRFSALLSDMDSNN